MAFWLDNGPRIVYRAAYHNAGQPARLADGAAHAVTDQDAKAGQGAAANANDNPAMQRGDAGVMSATHATPDAAAGPDADTVADVGSLWDTGCVRQAAAFVREGVTP